ncbi:hypothetical protein CC1G_02622 [Coprinopsis cinerea okayama7|uniref:Uncharacterized protein n=1 Tax=Coprinopsis cinerea (strain Okayama-7 / 130 / ATCC MYA-4618 / FGSC 9003) TaxID=240176 RepID=A8PBD8_COPC7|nr:hypothetical protein CC1G_02622 [Coprinopsis cinerea okayama7\|eukprot:XP_001840159.1 hypothetical protein CC1G_02622 [Coprinopsis cinerea okayama7\
MSHDKALDAYANGDLSTLKTILSDFPDEITISFLSEDPSCITEFHEREGTLLALALRGAAPKAFIEHLLSLGADPNIISGDAIAPLGYAASRYGDTPDMVALLVKNGARIDRGTAPLARAAYKGHLAIAQYLLDNGADVNDPGNWDLPGFPLLDAVDDPALVDGWGKTAFDIAREKGREEIVSLLKEAVTGR